MKNLLTWLIAIAFFCLANIASAEDCTGPNCTGQNTDVDVSVGSENFVFVNSGGGSDGSNRQFTSTHLYPNYPGYGPINTEYNKWIPFRSDIVIDPAMLMSKAELDKWLPHLKFGKVYKMPATPGPQKMFRMSYGRQSPEDVMIADPVLVSEDGGDPNFTERVLLSFAWHYLNARRFATEIFIAWEPHAGGFSLPTGGGYSKITAADEAISASAAPMMGWAWTTIQMPYKMRLKVYNDGHVWLYEPSSQPTSASAPTSRQSATLDIPVTPIQSIFFDTDKYNIRASEMAKISEIAEYYLSNLDSLNRAGHKLLILASCDIRLDKRYNDHLGGNRAETTHKAILAELANRGANIAEAEEMIVFSTSGNRRAAKNLNHDDRRADIYRVQRVSEAVERNTTR